MSMFFDTKVNPSGRKFRRAVQHDIKDIELFWNRENTDTLFCNDNLGSLIELSTLAICMVEEDEEVTGFLVLDDHPPIPSVDPAHWEIWVRNMFQKYYLSHNTLFIHFICYADAVSDFFLEEALMAVFMNDFYLQHIILVVPATCKIDCVKKFTAFKKRMTHKSCSKADDQEFCISLCVAMRKHFCPKLKVRRAVEEDNDEIVQILDKKCTKLKDLYGEYYVSEILSRHPESTRQFIVAELQDKVVGVMCLSADVNYKKLQSLYELGPYHGLLLANPLERQQIKRNNPLLKGFGEPIMLGKWSPFQSIPKDIPELSRNIKQTRSKDDIFRSRSRMMTTSRVNFHPFHPRAPKKFSVGTRSNSQESNRTNFSANQSLVMTESSVMVLLDDEPLDYDIVNIDNVLFSIAEAPSVDVMSSSTGFTTISKAASMGVRKMIRGRNSLSPVFEEKQGYVGKPNAFLIELFGLSDHIDGRRAFDMLEAAFESMPSYDYCIIRVPCSEKAFALLHHFAFVPTKPFICCRYALYVAHKNSVLGKFRVRKAEFADIPQIATLFANVDGQQTIRTVEESIAYNKQRLAFVLLSGLFIVGVGILDPPDYIELIKAKFVLDDYQHTKYHVPGHGNECGFAMLKTVLAYPAFEPHYGFFAREMMRQAGASTIIWLTAYRNKLVAHKANALASVMTPLPYRKSAESGLVSELKHVYHVSKNLLSFSAWYLSKNLTSIPKLNVDTRIVVIGASRTAISFLFNMLFGDSSNYLTFTNVTLVSTNGLPYVRHPLPAAHIMFPRYQSTTDRFLKSTPFTYYVNVVQGTMVEINKRDKYIVTNRGGKLYYDMLFLLMGKQFQHPDYLKELRKKERLIKFGNIPQYVRMDDPRYIETQMEPPTEYNTPENVFLINSIADATRALNTVKTFHWRFDDYKICVYGAKIEAYCCISALMKMDVPGSSIIYVEPFPPEDETKPRVPIFCNTKVDETLMEFLNCLDITTYRGYHFHSWKCDEDNVMYSVDFLSMFHFVTIECCALFYYGKRNINSHAFVAINRCGLPYDGGILIDHMFRTNNPYIYAAGTASRYYRRYYADDKLQKFYCSYEVGKMLGIQIRNQLDPLFSKVDSEKLESITARRSFCRFPRLSGDQASYINKGSLEDECSVPTFTKPMVWYCLLPGDLQYLEVRPPGVKFPHYYIQSLDYNGIVLETYVSGYFKLHLTKDLRVDGITCLTPAKYSVENFKRLYGLSSVMLNNVYTRFQAGMIKDFFEFFRKPWSVYIYNERSEQMLSLIKYVRPKDDPHGKTLEEVLHSISEEINVRERNYEATLRARSTFEKSYYFDAIADFVMEWLSDHELTFPMYVTPTQMLEYTFDLDSHPALKRSKKSIKQMLATIV